METWMGESLGTTFGDVFSFVHHVVLKRVVYVDISFFMALFVPGRTQLMAFFTGICWLKAYI
jgi:hypothetical protein